VAKRKSQAPAGRKKLVPNVSLVVFHVVLLEERGLARTIAFISPKRVPLDKSEGSVKDKLLPVVF